jgi:hypothetical protein
VSRRPPRVHRPHEARLAAALRALREPYFAVRPAPDLRSRVATALRPRLHAAARRTALARAATLLVGLAAGSLLARLPAPPGASGVAPWAFAPAAPSADAARPPDDPATARLRRLVASAEALPHPSPGVVATWRDALLDPDPDVRAAAAALLRAAGEPCPCDGEAP